MALTIIRDPLSGNAPSAGGGTRMLLRTESGGQTFAVPVAPRDITYAGLGQEWVTAERSGDTPLLLRKAGRLKTMAFSFLLTDKFTMFAPQELARLETLVGSTERLLVRYGPDEVGLWRVTECSLTSELRHPVTNAVVRAVVSMTLTRVSDAAPAVGPVSGGATTPPAAPSAPAPQRTYRVVSGDSLWRIAQRYYGNGGVWRRIFDANLDKIRNPGLIYPGQIFVIP